MIGFRNQLMLFPAILLSIKAFTQINRIYETFATATHHGVSHAHLNMPCEKLAVRQKLAKVLGLENKCPLLIIMYGYSEKIPNSYKRNI